MSLVERVALVHFDHIAGEKLSTAEKVRVEQIQELNALPLAKFEILPEEMREFAEDLWAARVVDVNLKRQAERRARMAVEVGEERKAARTTVRYSWRP
jgi:hypothetical protein